MTLSIPVETKSGSNRKVQRCPNPRETGFQVTESSIAYHASQDSWLLLCLHQAPAEMQTFLFLCDRQLSWTYRMKEHPQKVLRLGSNRIAWRCLFPPPPHRHSLSAAFSQMRMKLQLPYSLLPNTCLAVLPPFEEIRKNIVFIPGNKYFCDWHTHLAHRMSQTTMAGGTVLTNTMSLAPPPPFTIKGYDALWHKASVFSRS